MSGDPAGILVIDKPAGFTSHDVVARLRRLLGIRRIGHGGTLDPLATGVLPICIGTATRVAEYFARWPKTYDCTLRLGVSTDTYDAEGTVTSERDASGVTAADIERELAAFRGEFGQMPPPYSAIKIAGRPLYDYARSGETVAVAERRVRIDRITLISYEPPEARIEIECGSGTYVRSLVHDLGEALGPGAHVTRLVRTAVGPFALAAATTLDELAAAVEDASWQELLLAPDTVLADLTALMLSPEDARKAVHGISLNIEQAIQPSEGALARAYDEQNRFLAILRYSAEEGVWRPHKVFANTLSA